MDNHLRAHIRGVLQVSPISNPHSIPAQYITQTLLHNACPLTPLNSNALALELITSQHAHTGTLITFAQFLLIAIFGLRRQLEYEPRPNSNYDLKLKIPPSVQVVDRGAAYRVIAECVIHRCCSWWECGEKDSARFSRS